MAISVNKPVVFGTNAVMKRATPAIIWKTHKGHRRPKLQNYKNKNY